MKRLLGIVLVFGTIAMFVWYQVPRLISEVWHARDFVPAQSYAITGYKCTTWNLFMFNDCTASFVSLQSGESREFTDWRFGWSPSGPVQLLQRRGDASAVTTDVSLRTLWNRILVALALVVFGTAGAIGLIASAFKDEDAPVGAPSGEPSSAPSSGPAPAPVGRATLGEPVGRSTFGKRQA